MGTQGYKTSSRAKILAYLKDSGNRPVSVSDIGHHMEAEQCPVSATTIYRYLERLEEEGNLIKYAAGADGKATYQYADHSRRCDEHLHLRCISCGSVEHLDCHFMEEISDHIAREHGFSLRCRNSVIYGLCRKCQKQDTSRQESSLE